MNRRESSFWESIPPGMGHLRGGFFGPGLRYLAFFLLWLATLIVRGHRLPPLVSEGSFLDVASVVYLLAIPFLLVWIAHRSLRNCVNPPSREGLGTWQLAFRELKRNTRAVWGASILALLYSAAILAPVLAPYEESVPGAGPEIVHKLLPPGERVVLLGVPDQGEEAARDLTVIGNEYVLLHRGKSKENDTLMPISKLGMPPRGWDRRAGTATTIKLGATDVPARFEHYLLGTDARGRDLLSRLLYGARISLFIGFVAMFVAITLGVIFGSLAGYMGGWVDTIIMRLVDILLAFPRLLLLLLIVSIYENAGIFTVIAILGATGWMGVSRLVRAEFLRIKELDYSHAAKAFGYGRNRIMFRHLLPNSLAPVIVNATLLVGNTILVEAALSFLGFGVQPPDASWGNIISDGQDYLEQAWWICTIPGLLIVLAVVCINLVGDALRDALDPKSI